MLVVMVGFARTMEVLPAVIVCGLSFAGVQFYVSNYMGPELTDILSSLACIGAMVLVIKFWKPKNIFRLEGEKPATVAPKRHTPGELFQAWLPYMLLVAFVLVWGEADVKAALDRFTNGLLPSFLPRNPNVLNGLNVPGLHNLITRMPPVTAAPAPYAAVFALNWLTASGTACFLATIAAAIFLRVKPGQFVGIYKATFHQLAKPMITIASMLALAYLMNYSGMTSTLGLALATTGGAFPFFSAMLGWLGVFLTGSDTSSNALFGNLQVITANALGLNPDPDGLGELGGRRDGEDDFAPEHRRRGRRHRADHRRRRQAVPLHHQAQRVPGVRRRGDGDGVRLRGSGARAGGCPEMRSKGGGGEGRITV